MPTYAQREKRAKSNVKAATKALGVTGCLKMLEAVMLENAVKFPAESVNNAHYTALSIILEKACAEFSKECERFDVAVFGADFAGKTWPDAPAPFGKGKA